MNNLIEPNWKDEILSDTERYRIRKNNEIIQDDISIEQITPTIQEPTPLNKKTLETPIGEIRFFSNQRDDRKYLLCDGSRIYTEDYPELVKVLPRKYTYSTLPLDTAYNKVTQIRYFPEKDIFIMVRQGVSDTIGFGIFTSSDGNSWTLRYTSANAYYYYPPTIQYMKELNLFVGVSSLVVMVSSDGYNWTLSKSYSSSSDYRFCQPIYSQLLGKAILVQYDTDSTYYTTVYGTTDFINLETICSQSGSLTQVLSARVIENKEKLVASGVCGVHTSADRCTLWVSTNNGASFSSTSNKFNTNACAKYGEYWYSCYHTGSDSGSKCICRTKDFENFEMLTTNTASTSIIGVINGYLFYRINGVLKRRDLNDNVTDFPDTSNLRYLSIRKEYMKIMDKELYCSNDLITWKKYDNMPASAMVTELYTCSNGSIFVGSTSSASNYDMVYTYNENQINLPEIAINYAYIKASSESE